MWERCSATGIVAVDAVIGLLFSTSPRSRRHVAIATNAAATKPSSAPARGPKMSNLIGRLLLRFEAAQETNLRGGFTSRGPGYAVAISDTGVALSHLSPNDRPKAANLLLEVAGVALGLICWLPATPARAQQYSRGNRLIGKWSGYRPTDGYIYEIRYQLEFLSDGTYRYVARQASPKRPPWEIELHGRFTMARSDSKYWQATLVLVPDTGSASPQTQADRKALVDELGLPDNKPRNFRVRKESFRDGFDFQLTDADPSDGVEQVWYLARAGD